MKDGADVQWRCGVGASFSSVGVRVPSEETRLVLHMPLGILKSILHFTRQMELTVSFVIRGVVEFPDDVRRWPGLEAPFFSLVLVITCLYEHRST